MSELPLCQCRCKYHATPASGSYRRAGWRRRCLGRVGRNHPLALPGARGCGRYRGGFPDRRVFRRSVFQGVGGPDRRTFRGSVSHVTGGRVVTRIPPPRVRRTERQRRAARALAGPVVAAHMNICSLEICRRSRMRSEGFCSGPRLIATSAAGDEYCRRVGTPADNEGASRLSSRNRPSLPVRHIRRSRSPRPWLRFQPCLAGSSWRGR